MVEERWRRFYTHSLFYIKSSIPLSRTASVKYFIIIQMFVLLADAKLSSHRGGSVDGCSAGVAVGRSISGVRRCFRAFRTCFARTLENACRLPVVDQVTHFHQSGHGDR